MLAMTREDIDWSILRGAIIIFMISFLFSGALISGSWYFKGEMLKKYNASKKRFQAISSQYLTVDEQERKISQYHPVFLKLFDAGVIGGEQRLNWIETLRDVGERIKLPALRYEIDSQDVYTPGYSINTGSFKVYRSGMQLRLDLLHEGDMFKVLHDLDKRAQGIYSVKGCKMLRRRGGSIENIEKANILTECTLDWFTIKKSDGSEIKQL